MRRFLFSPLFVSVQALKSQGGLWTGTAEALRLVVFFNSAACENEVKISDAVFFFL